MHLIVLEYEPSSFRGGLGLSVFDVCRALYQRGHSISLLYMKEGNLLKPYQEFCTHILKVDNFILDRSTISQSFNFLNDLLRVRTSRDSVVYCNRYHDVFFGYVLSVLRNIPFICHLRLPPLPKFGRPQSMGLNGAKKLIAISNQTKLDWVNNGFKEEKIDVVYNGINTELYKPCQNYSVVRSEGQIPEDTKVISYLGRLDREKGIEVLIKAFALLPESNKKLLIAGKPISHDSPEAGEKYKQSLKQLATDLGVEDNVNFLGPVSNTTSVYQLSDLTVLPSLWSEPFGRTIVESMACGTPIVASRTGGIPEILTGEFQSWLCEPGSERDLADTLVETLNWRDNDPDLGKRCREHVLSRFTLDKMIDGIEEILLKAVKQ